MSATDPSFLSGTSTGTSTGIARGVRVEAPAKLNLLLHVLAREASGFHGLESLFVKLALHDLVTVRVDTDGRSLHCAGPSLPAGGLGAPEDNLAWRAAERFAEATGWPTGWAIAIEKHIPVGGGLGGGSADAAAVLRGLNAIAPAPLSEDALLRMAGTLGSDVPFLTSDALLAWTWGRGDRLLPLQPLPPMAALLLAYDAGVDTGAAYRALAAQRAGARADRPAPGARAYPADAFASWERVAALAANDFEEVVPGLHAGVARGLAFVRSARDRMQSAGERATIGQLSGSGATCFLLHAPDAPGVPTARSVGDDPLATTGGARLVATRTATAIVAPEPIL